MQPYCPVEIAASGDVKLLFHMRKTTHLEVVIGKTVSDNMLTTRLVNPETRATIPSTSCQILWGGKRFSSKNCHSFLRMTVSLGPKVVTVPLLRMTTSLPSYDTFSRPIGPTISPRHLQSRSGDGYELLLMTILMVEHI